VRPLFGKLNIAIGSDARLSPLFAFSLPVYRPAGSIGASDTHNQHGVQYSTQTCNKRSEPAGNRK
jgi:hypothetical protein